MDAGIVEQDEPAAVLHPENLTAESEEQALVGLAPAKAGGLEVMYDLDYSRDDGLDDGRIQRQSAALALTPETLPRRLPLLGRSVLKKKQKRFGRLVWGDIIVKGTCWFLGPTVQLPPNFASRKSLPDTRSWI